MLSDRLIKVNDKRGNETASVQMLISCAILPNNANGCSPATVDTAWRFISGINGGINNGFKKFISCDRNRIKCNKDYFFKYKRLVNEECYPYVSGKDGLAPACEILNSESHQSINCPSSATLKMPTSGLINSGAPYPINVESAVSRIETDL